MKDGLWMDVAKTTASSENVWIVSPSVHMNAGKLTSKEYALYIWISTRLLFQRRTRLRSCVNNCTRCKFTPQRMPQRGLGDWLGNSLIVLARSSTTSRFATGCSSIL